MTAAHLIENWAFKPKVYFQAHLFSKHKFSLRYSNHLPGAEVTFLKNTKIVKANAL
jgi:hypothetical protein